MAEKISATEAARRYRVNERTIRNWIKTGVLYAETGRVAGPRQYAIDTAELEQILVTRHLPVDPDAERQSSDSAVQKQLEHFNERISALEQQMAALSAPKQREKRVEVVQYQIPFDPPTGPSQAQKTGTLPQSLTPFFHFTHGIPNSTAGKWRDKLMKEDENQRWFVRGKWQLEDGHEVTVAVTSEGQHAYHEWASTRRGFKPCPKCVVCQKDQEK